MAKAVRFSEVLLDTEGKPLRNVVYTVLLTGTSTLAEVYDDAEQTPHAGSLTTNGFGNATFWVSPGLYDIKVGSNPAQQLPYIGEDERDTLDTSMLGELVASLDPDSGTIPPEQLPSNARNAYVKPSGGISRSDLAAAVQALLDLAASALQTAPVLSVNGQTGEVLIDTSSGGGGGTVVGDASPTSKGVIKLTGPMGGTADAPLIFGIATKAAFDALLAGKVATDDPRLTDSRPAANNGVTNASVAANANIDPAKIAGLVAALSSKYQVPSGGIPAGDLAATVQALLALAGTAVQTSSGKVAASILPGPAAKTFTASTGTPGTTAAFNDVIGVDATAAAATVTLPTASVGSLPIVVKKIDSSTNTVTIVGTIDGSANFVLNNQQDALTLVPQPVGNGYWIV